MVAAKTNSAHASLSKQFKEHSTERRYHALVWGTFKEDEGRIEKPLGRSLADRKKISTRTNSPRWAATRYRVLKRFPSITLLELSPETGRTHQIRVHLKSISHAIIGDPLYGAGSLPGSLAKPIADMIKGIKRQCLHAMELGLTHPESGERLTFNAPYPEDMRSLIEALEE
jgi:23S rRNA pseudouridine1911/1915/1917 synthase